MYVPTGIVDVVHTAKAAALTVRGPTMGLATVMTAALITPFAKAMAASIGARTPGRSVGRI